MANLWLTYAWSDNEDQDIDFVIQELQRTGLNVQNDQANLLVGRRLWEQIDQHIMNENLDAWAIYVTGNSLASEPCREELAYALDRSLRARGSDFPVIGIFPAPVDRALLPSAIATRLYVDLRRRDWADQIARSLNRSSRVEAKEVESFGHQLHDFESVKVLEVWPRVGTWCPAFAQVPEAEADALGVVIAGARGVITGTGIVSMMEMDNPGFTCKAITDPVSAERSLQVFLKHLPSKLKFGGDLAGVRQGFQMTFNR